MELCSIDIKHYKNLRNCHIDFSGCGRVAVFAKNKWAYNQNAFYVKIEPEKCIKKVKIAPWVDKKTAEIIKRAVCEYGFNPAMISQSRLYDRPGLRVNLVKK